MNLPNETLPYLPLFPPAPYPLIIPYLPRTKQYLNLNPKPILPYPSDDEFPSLRTKLCYKKLINQQKNGDPLNNEELSLIEKYEEARKQRHNFPVSFEIRDIKKEYKESLKKEMNHGKGTEEVEIESERHVRKMCGCGCNKPMTFGYDTLHLNIKSYQALTNLHPKSLS